MQIKKKNVRINIIESAKIEFIDHGYLKAKIRDISKRAKITTSNIYNYFLDKDDILAHLLKPSIDATKSIFIDYKFIDALNNNNNINDHIQSLTLTVTKYVFKNKDYLRILFFKTKGSLFYNYKIQMVKSYSHTLLNNINCVRKQYPDIEISISNTMVYNLSNFVVTTIVDIVKQDITYEQIKEHLFEVFFFLANGLKVFIKKTNSY